MFNRVTCSVWRGGLLWGAGALIAGFSGLAFAQVGDKVALGNWSIDRTEVTIGQFERYVRATGTVTRAEKEGGGFEYVGGWVRRPGWSWRQPDGVQASANLPAVHLDFAEAQAYCRWAGGRLPTGAEWQKAGFTELRDNPPAPWVKGKTYPWSTGDSPQGANTSDPDPWPRAAPAGATRQGVNGLYDMGANVWEWTTDEQGGQRRTVGGSWWYGAFNMKADVQAFKAADVYVVYLGFRCAYDLPLQNPNASKTPS
ncbi:formylglycine-generating enzyme family protein [Limnohabitans sp. 63ED37-2]|uniref:formylglycine-generating enzyme family protein n=1 Tax=Limnohabitans sp. 63ED37-2 TaxID=1678128 RepID=UPI0007057BCE|nr:formylglycine-generating enzyme family protein [Limnohabitans sp. 63ED37-2]ALK88500.1 Formylglycine-generating sulfatase enzyme [Limnohabitans sp. 63ED37-2]